MDGGSESQNRLRELQSSEGDRLRMVDLWRFQSTEIAEAALTSDAEDTELEAEKRVLANAEKLSNAANAAHDLLYESEGAAESTLGAALRHIEELARYDARFAEPAQQLAAAKATVEDVDATVRDFADTMEASPGRLAEIEDRLAALERLKRKYGPTLADVIAFGAAANERLGEVENRDALLEELKRRLADEAGNYRAAAAEVTARRTEAAARLGRAAEVEMNELAMRVRFSIGVTSRLEPEHWSAAWE